jgi:uncharacterized protein YjbI with pentapeptide repeats
LGVAAPPQPILPTFPYPCNGPHKDKKLSKDDISQILKAHKKWLTNSKDPEGQQANFCGAKLSYSNFQGADLTSAVFQMAMLENANFTEAHLIKAQLQGANLSKASFSQADLTAASLDDAMLHRAKFENAALRETSLLRVMLYQAEFHQAKLPKAKLQGVDVRDVKGLTQGQINTACLDGLTLLPTDLTRPKPCGE